MHVVYMSASMQIDNIGAGNYGTEQFRMFQLSDKAATLLQNDARFIVHRNQPFWSLKQLVDDVNSKCDRNAIFIDNHSNAGELFLSEGTEVYYYGKGGLDSDSYRLANELYSLIAPLSFGKDRGIKADTTLYTSGLYVIQNTIPPACLVEHFFHSNIVEVNQFLDTIDDYAYAIYKAVLSYFNIEENSFDVDCKCANVRLKGFIEKIKNICVEYGDV